MKILIVGPSITRTKGGMATVISDMLLNNSPNYSFVHIVSHVEGSAMEKILFIFKSLVQMLRATGVDIIHIHVASDASFFRKSFFVVAGRLKNIPVFMHVHGADFHLFFQNSRYKWFIRFIFSLCSKVLVLSHFWKQFFEEHITKKNVTVLHNGVYVDVFKECYTTPQHINHFLFLGRLGQRKGVYDLLNAIDSLVNIYHKKELHFYLAGDGEIEQVERFITSKALQSNVHLLGWIGHEEKLDWFKKVDTILLPSYNEGLPMAILEAMAAGKIIISSRVGGIPDLVTEGENGFLIDPGDVKKLEEHILFVSTHPEVASKLAQNNIAKISLSYNLTKINTSLYEMYKVAAHKKQKL